MILDKTLIKAILLARTEIMLAWMDEGRDLVGINDVDELTDAVYKLLSKRANLPPK